MASRNVFCFLRLHKFLGKEFLLKNEAELWTLHLPIFQGTKLYCSHAVCHKRVTKRKNRCPKKNNNKKQNNVRSLSIISCGDKENIDSKL